MSDDEAARETRRRMRSVLAKDLLQLERSMIHYGMDPYGRHLRDLAFHIWDSTADDRYGEIPAQWWHCPEVWEE